MSWLSIILVIALFFLLIRTLRHEVFRKSLRLFVTLFIILAILAVTAYYVDISQYFSKDNFVTQTGASVVKSVKSNLANQDFVNEGDLEMIMDKGINKMDKTLEKVKNGKD